MQYQLNPYALLPLCTALVSLILTSETWRRRGDPASPPFIALTLLVALWSFGNAWELVCADVATALFWVRVEYLAIVSVPVAWLVMMLAFAERRRSLGRAWLAALLVIPLLTTTLIWSESAIPLFWRSFLIETLAPLTLLRVERGPWFWVHTAYSYLLLAAGSAILLRSLFGTSGLYRNQSLALLLGAAAPWAVNCLYVFGLIPPAFPDPTALAFVVTGLAFSWAIREAGLFELGPAAYRELIQQMSDGVVVLDPLNRVLDINPAAARAFDRPPCELVGQPFRALMAGRPDLFDRYRDLLRVDQPLRTEIGIPVAGQLLVYDLQITPLRWLNGRLSGRMLVWRDITELRQAMARIRDQNERLASQALALQEAKAAAEAGSQARSAFLASMSHELRTPLSSILGYLDLIHFDRAAQDGAALDRDLASLRIAGEHLLRMIGGVLDYAKIEAGKMQLDLSSFHVHGLAVEALASVRPLIERNANRLELVIPHDVGNMHADPLKVRQVLINLLSNAARFTQAGVVTLRVAREAGWVIFEVADTGVGMSESQLVRLFEEFSQVSGGPAAQVGTGLGLALSQKLCQLMGGQITAWSKPGQGSTFTVRLPERVGE